MMYKNKEPIILSKDKMPNTYVTLDTIYTPLMSVMMQGKQAYVEAYYVDKINVDIRDLKRKYATEQFIYRITGVCCFAYDSMLARACVCLINHACCYAWSERKRNFIILPDSYLLPDNLYWITVFELVYKLKYPQSDDTNKCLVYALNCMLKAGMLTIDDYMKADEFESARHDPLYTYSLHRICMCLRDGKLRLPKSVYRYYRIFGKRLKRKYKNDRMLGGEVCHLPKDYNEYDVAEAYTDALCECIKLNPPVLAGCINNRRKSKGQFADVRQMKDNIDLAYVYTHLHIHGEPAKDRRIYSNPWAFVRNSILQAEGMASASDDHIYLKSEYFAFCTVEENSIHLMFTLFHECGHLYHWRAKERYNSMITDDAHENKCGATYEHHANKFALWNLIVYGISIETISRAHANILNKLSAIAGGTVVYSYRVLLRYCRMLSYFNSKYGKLYMPIDLGYIFINRETGKLYKPNDEVKCVK